MLLSLLFLASTVFADNKFLVLSGGDSPAMNHHSQYLQTKALYEFLRDQYGKQNTTVLFGAGNAPDRPIEVVDVHRLNFNSKLDDKVSELIPGIIEGNQAATLENVKSTFNSISSQLTSNDVFFLLVSDHGMPHPDEDKGFTDNCINLWGYDKSGESGYSQRSMEDRCLSVSSLKKTLAEKIKPKRTVFAMTQCYSGGFHEMSVNLKSQYPKADPKVCGFTAVTEDTVASGCTADSDGPGYQGYERSLTEKISGRDFVQNRQKHGTLPNLLQAHEAATLEDLTVDIPLKTSQYYLWKWGKVLIKKDFVSRSSGSIDAARVAMKAALDIPDAGSDGSFHKAMAEQIANQYPDLKILIDGSFESIKTKQIQLMAQAQNINDDFEYPATEALEIRKQIFTQWWASMKDGSISNIDTEIKLAESSYFGPLEHQLGSEPFAQTNLHEKMLLEMSVRAAKDPIFARNTLEIFSTRDKVMLAWAEAQSPELREAAIKYQRLKAEMLKLQNEILETTKKFGLIRRILVYRSVGASEEGLKVLKETKALEEVQALRECESTPF